MAYKTEELEQLAIEAIEKHKLIFIEEIASYLPCSEKTLRNHKLQELPTIKKAIQDNKISMKAKLRKKWYDSNNATIQLALYKLLANEEEFNRLAQNKHDHTSKGDKIESIAPINWVNGSN